MIESKFEVSKLGGSILEPDSEILYSFNRNHEKDGRTRALQESKDSKEMQPERMDIKRNMSEDSHVYTKGLVMRAEPKSLPAGRISQSNNFTEGTK